MCDEVNPPPTRTTRLPARRRHHVAVTDANGDTYYVDCAAQVVVGDYIGAQMAGFDAAAPLGLIDHLQDGEPDQRRTRRAPSWSAATRRTRSPSRKAACRPACRSATTWIRIPARRVAGRAVGHAGHRAALRLHRGR